MESFARYCRFSFAAALLFSITLMAEGRAQAPETLPETPDDSLYVIQPNDLLNVFVYNEQELSGQVLVRPDGRISLPLVQDLQAAGLSPGELKLRIEERLQEYLELPPNVTVIVDAIQSYRVYVTGQVAMPGMLTAAEPISVMQALSLAGGLLDFADSEGIVIIRNTGENSKLFRFRYSEVIRGENFSQNMLLHSGDVVVVP